MDIFTDTIRDLPVADKMLLVQRIWDDLSSTADTVPLPQWALSEASRRRDEMWLTRLTLGSERPTTKFGHASTIGEMARSVRYNPDFDTDVIDSTICEPDSVGQASF